MSQKDDTEVYRPISRPSNFKNSNYILWTAIYAWLCPKIPKRIRLNSITSWNKGGRERTTPQSPKYTPTNMVFMNTMQPLCMWWIIIIELFRWRRTSYLPRSRYRTHTAGWTSSQWEVFWKFLLLLLLLLQHHPIHLGDLCHLGSSVN